MFRLRLQLVLALFLAILALPTAVEAQRIRRDISVGSSVVGTISGSSEIHDWVFWGQPGQQVRLRVAARDGLSANVTFTAANGRILWTAESSGSVTSDWLTVPRPGFTTITVRGGNGTSGSYTLDTAGADQQFVDQGRGDLTFGTPVRGWLASDQQQHIYGLIAPAGITISPVVRGADGLVPTLSIRDPNGQEIFAGRGVSGSISGALVRIATTGRYSVQVGADRGSSGSYELTILVP